MTYILPIIILPYLMRTIGPAKFGLITFAQAFVQYFMILTDYGFSLTATKKLAVCQNQKQKTCSIFSSVFTVKIILSATSFLILAAIINIFPRFRNDWLVYFLSFGAVIGNTLFPVWFFQGQEKMKYIAIINICGGTIYTICIFLFVHTPQDYLIVPLLTSLFFIATGIAGLFVAFRKFKLQFVVQTYEDIKEEFRTGRDIFFSIVAINAYTSTRVFAVGLLTNNILTGYYSVAERIASVIQAFPLDSFSQAIYPRLNSIFSRNKLRAVKIMKRIQATMTFGSLLCLPFIFYFSPWIVRLVCGIAYPETVLSLRILIVSVFFVTTNAFRVQFLLVCGKPDYYSKLHIAAAIVGLPLIFTLIHFFSYPGAAISTIGIELGVILTTSIIIKRLGY
jgi:PST family polysaccharide transporter